MEKWAIGLRAICVWKFSFWNKPPDFRERECIVAARADFQKPSRLAYVMVRVLSFRSAPTNSRFANLLKINWKPRAAIDNRPRKRPLIAHIYNIFNRLPDRRSPKIPISAKMYQVCDESGVPRRRAFRVSAGPHFAEKCISKAI